MHIFRNCAPNQCYCCKFQYFLFLQFWFPLMIYRVLFYLFILCIYLLFIFSNNIIIILKLQWCIVYMMHCALWTLLKRSVGVWSDRAAPPMSVGTPRHCTALTSNQGGGSDSAGWKLKWLLDLFPSKHTLSEAFRVGNI
jgi:hypothetical protein